MLNITNIDPAGWFDMAEAPRTGEVIEVFVPGKYDLPGFICDCAWTIEGGFCVDELREPVAWRRKAPKASPDTPCGFAAHGAGAAPPLAFQLAPIAFQAVPDLTIAAGSATPGRRLAAPPPPSHAPPVRLI